MSLNKLTDSSTEKKWMNISCNDVKCSTLEVAGVALGKSGKYSAPPITISVAGSTVVSGFTYYNIVGKQLHITASRLVILGASSNNFTVTVPLPTGFQGTPNTASGGVAVATDGTTSVVLSQLPSLDGTGDNLLLPFLHGTPLTAGGNSFIHLHAIIELP